MAYYAAEMHLHRQDVQQCIRPTRQIPFQKDLFASDPEDGPEAKKTKVEHDPDAAYLIEAWVNPDTNKTQTLLVHPGYKKHFPLPSHVQLNSLVLALVFSDRI